MAAPRPHNVANWIAEGLPGSEIRSLRTAIAQVIKLHAPGISDEFVAEYAETLEPEVYVELGVVEGQNLDHGVLASFQLEGEANSAYIRPVHLQARIVLERIRGLSPIGFEDFCAKLLDGLGASSKRVGGTNDGGVDFEAVNVPLRNDMPALYRCRPRVIGQAKRYSPSNLVSLSEVRSFLGAALIRADEQRRGGGLSLYAPLVFAFWTTSDLNRGALDFAKQAGIWYLSGVALAQAAHAVGVDP